MGDWGHIQLIDLRTMTKAGNECPRSVTYPQQDQNQLDGNDRVSVVCVRNLWKSEAMNVNWHVKVVCEESSKRWTKRSLPKGCQQVQPQHPYWLLKFVNSCEMYNLSWPHRHLFDCDSITSSAEPVKGVFLVICNLAISSLPTCSAGLFEALSRFNPLIIFEGVWQCLRWWPIIRAVATSVVAPGLFRESGPAMWANTVSKLSKLMLLGIPWIQRVLDKRLE